MGVFFLSHSSFKDAKTEENYIKEGNTHEEDTYFLEWKPSIPLFWVFYYPILIYPTVLPFKQKQITVDSLNNGLLFYNKSDSKNVLFCLRPHWWDKEVTALTKQFSTIILLELCKLLLLNSRFERTWITMKTISILNPSLPFPAMISLLV